MSELAVHPEMAERIRECVEELAARDYPRVWVGEAGMTPAQYFDLERTNEELRRETWESMTPQERGEAWQDILDDLREELSEELPEEPPERWDQLPDGLRRRLKTPLELEPGEFVGIEDRNGEVRGGISVPKVSHRYLDGLYVVRHMPDALHPDVYAELHTEVTLCRYPYFSR